MKLSGRLLLILAAFVASFHFVEAQPGLGVGSSGLTVKTSPTGKFGFIGRLYFDVGSNNFIVPQVNLIRWFINEEKAKFYGGFGLNAAITIDDGFNYSSTGLRLPLGIEYFPFESKPFSIAVEGGLLLNTAEDYNTLGFTSLVELTFYLGKPNKE
jgi:hypothetical protein